MRLVEVGSIFINPDRVTFVRNCTPSAGGPVQTAIRFSGSREDEVTVKLSVGEVVELLRNG